MGDEQASRLEGLLQSSTTRVPIILLQRVEEILPAMRKSLNCLDALRGGHKPCTDTCSTASRDGKQFVFVNDDDDTVIKQQKDREPASSTAIKNDPVLIMDDEQASRSEGLLQSSTTRVPVILLRRVEEIFPAARKSLNCVDILRSEPGPCTETCQVSSGDGNQVIGKKVPESAYMKVEDDPGPTTPTGIEIESANCLNVLRGEHESCTETCSPAPDDGKQFVFVNVDDDTVIKQQEDPEPTTSTAIKNDPLLIMDDEQASRSEGLLQSSTTRVPVILLRRVEEIFPAARKSLNCLDALRGGHKSCTETCSTASGDGKQFVFVNDDDDTVIKQQKDREPMTSTAIKNDPLNCVNLLRSDSGSCSETCLMSMDDEKWDVDIKVEEVTDAEAEVNPQPKTFQTINGEPEVLSDKRKEQWVAIGQQLLL